MASYSISVTGSTIKFTIKGVPKGQKVWLFLRREDDNTNLIGSDYAQPTSTNSTSFSRSFADVLEENTDYVCNVAYPVYPATWLGAESFTTDSFGATRPYNWNWYSTVEQGAPIKLTALEWNDFCSRINEFRDYSGLSSYDFTRVSRGDPIEASVVNEARSAISSISGHGSLPSKARSGRAITAAFFNDLKDALNYID